MKKINILSTILAIGMLLGLASCDLDNNKNSPSLELDEDAVALVDNFIYVTPETKGNKGFKITLLYNAANPGFWDANRYVLIEVKKVPSFRAPALQLLTTIDIGADADGQRPTAEDPVKIIYFPFVEAGESYIFEHNTGYAGTPALTPHMEALCGAGEIHSIKPFVTYWNDGYKRLVKVNTTNKAIDACMDDVTIPYELRYGFGIERGPSDYKWLTGQDAIDGDRSFFKDLLTSDGADILSENQDFYLYLTKPEIDADLMAGSTKSYYQDKYKMNLIFDVSALLDADTYGNCRYKFIDISTGYEHTYYSKDTYVGSSGFVYAEPWNGLTRSWEYDSSRNFVSCTAEDDYNGVTRNWVFNSTGAFVSCTATDTWNGMTRNWVFNSTGVFVSCTAEDDNYIYYYDGSGNFSAKKSYWKVQSNGSYKFVQSGDVWTSNNQNKDSTIASTTFSIYLETDTSVSIPWTVSSESSWDKLTIKLDDTIKVDAVSGVNRGTITATLQTGFHTLVVQYEKDGSESRNDDCATVTLVPVP